MMASASMDGALKTYGELFDTLRTVTHEDTHAIIWDVGFLSLH